VLFRSVRGRQLVHEEVRRYVDPIISRQTEFNTSSVRIITRVSQRCDQMNQHLQELETAFCSFKQESDKKIADYITTIRTEQDSKIANCITTIRTEQDSKIESTIKDLLTQMDVDIHARTLLAHVLENRVQRVLAQKSALPAPTSRENTNYFLFEERFRGSREGIKQRQLFSFPTLKNVPAFSISAAVGVNSLRFSKTMVLVVWG
jgi:hypothetical protein